MNSKKTYLDSKIPKDAQILAEACSLHSRASMRLWIFAATITLMVLTADVSEDSIKFLWFQMDKDYFYPTCATLLAMINISYCSTYLQGHRALQIFHDLLESIYPQNQKFSRNYSINDVAHTLNAPTFNRIYPVTHYLDEKFGNYVYKYIKLPVDFLFNGLPFFGCVIALLYTPFNRLLLPAPPLPPLLEAVLLAALFLVLFLSMCLTLLVLVQGIIWIWINSRIQVK